MRSAGTSTWETPRKVKRSSTRYLGGCSEVCLTMWATASVTAAWKVTPPASRPARFTRTSWPGWKVAAITRSWRGGPLDASCIGDCGAATNSKCEIRNSRRRTNEEEQQDPTSEKRGWGTHMQDAGLSQESGQAGFAEKRVSGRGALETCRDDACLVGLALRGG